MGHSRVWGIVIFVFFLLLILSLLILDHEEIYENEMVLLIMNTLFTGVAPVVVSGIAARAYLQDNRTGALLMGCGMLIFGTGSIVTGFLRLLPDSVNVSITVYNTCALIGGGCHLWASQIRQTAGTSRVLSEKAILVSAYLGVLLFAAGLTIAALRGLTPLFFSEYGSTRIRDIVIWSAIALYFGAAMAISGKCEEIGSPHLCWYSLSLLMIALGLFGVSTVTAVGTLLGWAGRTAQYVGAVFACFAMSDIWRKARKNRGAASPISWRISSRTRRGIISASPSTPQTPYSRWGTTSRYSLPIPERSGCSAIDGGI